MAVLKANVLHGKCACLDFTLFLCFVWAMFCDFDLLRLVNDVFAGETIPTDDPCETCFCWKQKGGDVSCLTTACMPCLGLRVDVEGSCCGECHDVTIQPVVGCERNGVHYDVGMLCF